LRAALFDNIINMHSAGNPQIENANRIKKGAKDEKFINDQIDGNKVNLHNANQDTDGSYISRKVLRK
jgi:hypothetical protein